MQVYYLPRGKLVLGVVILLLCFAGTFTLLGEYLPAGWPVFSSQERLVPIYAVATDEKKVSISFDAAWGAEYTPQLLEILDKYGVKTTFFLVKFWVEKYPEVTRQIVAAGHELGNHSATHPHMNALTEEEVFQELEETNGLLERLTGQRPKLFRPPFGEYNNTIIRVAEELGMKTIQWSVDSLDWRDLTAEEIISRVLEQIEPGAIVLFHNNARHTPAALGPILEQLQADGYEIVPISQLILWENYYIDPHTGIQHPQKFD
ncbi:MAG TPA: polysaccharide deacetylase family protein [Firmicutes bacterium]|nr:polysaccharide deacetylase family protein [Bacillota bacterium]